MAMLIIDAVKYVTSGHLFIEGDLFKFHNIKVGAPCQYPTPKWFLTINIFIIYSKCTVYLPEPITSPPVQINFTFISLGLEYNDEIVIL